MKKIFKISLFSALLFVTPLLSMSCQNNLKINKEIDTEKINNNDTDEKMSEKIKDNKNNNQTVSTKIETNEQEAKKEIELEQSTIAITPVSVNTIEEEIPVTNVVEELNNEQDIQENVMEEKEAVIDSQEQQKSDKIITNNKMSGAKIAGLIVAGLIECGLVFGTAYGIYKYKNPTIKKEKTKEIIEIIIKQKTDTTKTITYKN